MNVPEGIKLNIYILEPEHLHEVHLFGRFTSGRSVFPNLQPTGMSVCLLCQLLCRLDTLTFLPLYVANSLSRDFPQLDDWLSFVYPIFVWLGCQILQQCRCRFIIIRQAYRHHSLFSYDKKPLINETRNPLINETMEDAKSMVENKKPWIHWLKWHETSEASVAAVDCQL